MPPMSTAATPSWCHDNHLYKDLERIIQETLVPLAGSGKRKRQGGLSRKAIQEVVQGFWLVVVGLKRAFLVESVQLDEAKCREICRRLGTTSGLGHVTTWYECTTASAFAVDITFLNERFRGGKGSGPLPTECIYIDLSKPDLPWNQAGNGIIPEYIKPENDSQSSPGPVPVVFSLKKADEFPILAGELLEYPVIYCSVKQKPGGGTYLDGTPLILVRVWLTKDGSQIEQLLSFTFTQALAVSLDRTADIVRTLVVRYEERLQITMALGRIVGYQEGLGIKVTTEAITLDKVVL